MTCLDGYKMRLVLVGFVAAVAIGGESARADFTFGKPTNMGPMINTSNLDGFQDISADGLTLFFDTDNRVGGYGGKIYGTDIWVTTRDTVDAQWGEPFNLGPPVNSSVDEGDASISVDGLSLYFWSYQRPGGVGASDLWVTTRKRLDSPWTEPVNLGPIVNSSANDSGPFISADSLSLYFHSARAGGFGVTDIYVTMRETTDDEWGPPINLGPTINGPLGEASPEVSPDGRVLFFNVGTSQYDLGSLGCFMAKRSTVYDPWRSPVKLPDPLNTTDVSHVSISSNGHTLYFTSNRPGGYGNDDIYQAPILPTVDFTGDYQVNIDDLTILIEHWGQNEPAFDMGPMPWGDGVVDAADLEVLMSYWGQPVYDPHFIAHWMLDETEGDVAYDSAAENDAVILGDAAWIPEGGKYGGALQLDGIDDYFDTFLKLNPADGPFSVFAWVKGGAPGQVILSQEGGEDWLLTDTQGCLMTALQSTSGRIKSGPLISKMFITDGNWHHVGFVKDDSERILYVDDIEVIRDTVNNLDSASGNLFIGSNSNLDAGTFWSGMIDDMRVYDRVVIP
jgi:hypothetical protein